MKIVWGTSETFPYAKTGGLADVSSSLTEALAKRGHEVSLIMPYYPQIFKERCIGLEVCLERFPVPFGNEVKYCRVLKRKYLDNLTYYFVDYGGFYDRGTLYDWYGEEYGDNAERYIFLSRAIMEITRELNLDPDIMHLNDWHTALCAVYLKSHPYVDDETFANCRSILTIHNIGYQGIYPKEKFPFTGLSWDCFDHSCLEYFDNINLLKGGILCADMVNTVSPSYADEILLPDYGFTLDQALQHVDFRGRLRGILNGIDTVHWNPAVDHLIAQNYNVEDLSGKAVCKEELQKSFNLPVKPRTPVFGIVSRLAYQKGIDVFSYCIDDMLENDDVQFVVLGSGDPALEGRLKYLADRYPEKMGVHIGYNEKLSHMVEAGSDMFVMPSRYEPCGLNQMYSMAYGTLPVVRGTGGLEDTVQNYDPKQVSSSTGFKFYMLTGEALQNTLKWAAEVYHNEPENFAAMQHNGMMTDFSWNHTACQYEQLYEDALNW